jgi:hypothetical protein
MGSALWNNPRGEAGCDDANVTDQTTTGNDVGYSLDLFLEFSIVGLKTILRTLPKLIVVSELGESGLPLQYSTSSSSRLWLCIDRRLKTM